MRTVIVESPLRGDYEANVAYAKKCMADCFRRGEAPFASHLLYPGVLDDSIGDQRTLGIEAGLAIGERLDATVVYLDRGVTPGMMQGIRRAWQCARGIEFRLFGDLDCAESLSWDEAKKVSKEVAQFFDEQIFGKVI